MENTSLINQVSPTVAVSASLYRPKIAYTDVVMNVPVVTPTHILQPCPTLDTLRQQNLAQYSGDLDEKLWGSVG